MVEIGFSPRGTYLSTWERSGESSCGIWPSLLPLPLKRAWLNCFADRIDVPSVFFFFFDLFAFGCPVKLEGDAQHKNLRIFSVSTGEELIALTQKAQSGWDLQYTITESHAIRLVGADVQVYRPAEWSKGIVDRLKVEGATLVVLSPGLNPSVAVFVAEKKVRRHSFVAISFTHPEHFRVNPQA